MEEKNNVSGFQNGKKINKLPALMELFLPRNADNKK